MSKTVSNTWFHEELRRLKKQKQKAYFKFLKKSDGFSKTEYNKIKNHHKQVIKTKKLNTKPLLEKYQTGAGSLWNTMNKIVGIGCYKPPNCVEVNNTIVSDEQKITDLFNTYFSSRAKKVDYSNTTS